MSTARQGFEGLGVFYLGREVDPAGGAGAGVGAGVGEPVLYDSRDLVTHAAIIGMTGSGKTGLGIALLEEAALDGIPALVIDPKGDLANLLLTFPDLSPDDFLPWVREEDAARKGIDRAALAAAEAKKWREGLAAWGQDGERIRRLREAAEVTLYTPGSDLAQPISILASFAAPPAALVADADLFGDRVATATTSLLGLAGLTGAGADPLRSREHILIATLLAEAWKAGRGYDLPGLIADLQKPPIAKVGVLDLETFFPAADRFQLALRINNLLAAPGFDVWLRGQPLAIDELLRTSAGKPRLAVISLAHLSDAERMFFVSLLLNETIAWMRSQSGTSSLRAIVYMDEVFGFLPPVAEPPSKKPMLTLLKQGRAFGLGLVLATQNPVDLDYKALSNIGTWLLGRLQTEGDKARVLDGLAGASAAAGDGFDRAAIDRLLSGLRSRLFLLHNVHDDGPTLLETRWVMSYLAGPIDRDGIRRLTGQSAAAGPAAAPAPAAPGTAAPEPASGVATTPPVLPPGIAQVYLPRLRAADRAIYRPAALGFGRAHVESAKHGVAELLEAGRLVPIDESGLVDWLGAEELDLTVDELESTPADGAGWAALPARAARVDSWKSWEKAFATALHRSLAVTLWRSAALKENSQPGENERDFRARLVTRAHEERDAAKDRLRDRYAARLRTLDDRIRRAEGQVAEQKQQASARKLDTAVSIGSTVLGVLFGRRKLSATTLGRAASSARSAGRSAKEAGDVERAEENLASLQQQKAELEAELAAQLDAVAAAVDPTQEPLEEIRVRPKKTDVEVVRVALAWAPHDAATGEPLWS